MLYQNGCPCFYLVHVFYKYLYLYYTILILKENGSKLYHHGDWKAIQYGHHKIPYFIESYKCTCKVCFIRSHLIVYTLVWCRRANDPLLKYPHGKQTLKPVVNIVFIDMASEVYEQSLAIALSLFDYLIG